MGVAVNISQPNHIKNLPLPPKILRILSRKAYSPPPPMVCTGLEKSLKNETVLETLNFEILAFVLEKSLNCFENSLKICKYP